MKQEVKIGQTDYSVFVDILTSTGQPATSLTTTSVTSIAYLRMETDNDATVTTAAAATLASITAAHADYGFLEVSSVSAPGVYRLDLPDAMFTSGAWSAVAVVNGTTFSPTKIEFVLTPAAPVDGVNVSQWNGTAVATPTVAGVPEVDVTHRLGTVLSGAEATVADIADAVWDEATSGHLTQGTFGELFAGITFGTCNGTGSSTTITLASGASSTDDFYNGALIKIVAGTGSIQRRWITDYTGSSRAAVVDSAISTDLTSKYVIV